MQLFKGHRSKNNSPKHRASRRHRVVSAKRTGGLLYWLICVFPHWFQLNNEETRVKVKRSRRPPAVLTANNVCPLNTQSNSVVLSPVGVWTGPRLVLIPVSPLYSWLHFLSVSVSVCSQSPSVLLALMCVTSSTITTASDSREKSLIVFVSLGPTEVSWTRTQWQTWWSGIWTA